MKFVSWNVNGIRAVLGKGFADLFRELDADIFCLQEIKALREQAGFEPEGYTAIYHSAERKGYSGTALFSKTEPLSVALDLPDPYFSGEGRVITTEFETFFLVNVYTPNAKPELARIDYRMAFEDEMRNYLIDLDKKKPVILCGDLNVAHEEIDLKNPGPNRGSAGFSDQERGKMTQLLGSGFVDSFRLLYPDRTGAYTWWSYRYGARKTNAGWRIDYFLVSKRLSSQIQDSVIYSEIMGSDHCPVGLMIDL